MSTTSSPTVFILPGLGGSGPAHWQSRWQAAHPEYLRVVQADWQHPVCREWTAQLDQAVTRVKSPCVLVAHSLGCHTVVHWASQTRHPVKGALLVAPPDLYAPDAPPEVVGFRPIPMITLPFPTIVVASSNDPYATLDFQRQHARAWGSRFVNAGALGHINADSGIGAWPRGYELFRALETGDISDST